MSRSPCPQLRESFPRLVGVFAYAHTGALGCRMDAAAAAAAASAQFEAQSSKRSWGRRQG